MPDPHPPTPSKPETKRRAARRPASADTTAEPTTRRAHIFQPSAFTVVRLEKLNEVANLKSDLIACYCPVNSQELFAIERIAIAQHTMLRGARVEAGLFTAALDDVVDATGYPITPMSPELIGDGDIEITRTQNRNFAAGEGFRRMAKESNVWSVLLRFQTQAERQYRRAIEDLERLIKLRPHLPSEPNAATEPDAPEETAAPSDLNPLISPETISPEAVSPDTPLSRAERDASSAPDHTAVPPAAGTQESPAAAPPPSIAGAGNTRPVIQSVQDSNGRKKGDRRGPSSIRAAQDASSQRTKRSFSMQVPELRRPVESRRVNSAELTSAFRNSPSTACCSDRSACRSASPRRSPEWAS